MPTRTTRSQSREPDAQPAQGRSSRGTRGASVESNASAQGGRHATRSVVHDLSTVAEDEAFAEPPNGQQIIEADEDEGEDASGFSQGRTSAVSGISGTTAKTSFSDEEIAEMDADIMLETLPSLDTASENLLKCLLPPDAIAGNAIPWSVWKDITTDNTKAKKLFIARSQAFDVFKQNFGSSEYIQTSHVLRVLFGVTSADDVPFNVSRPDILVRKANLANMLRALLVTGRHPLDLSGDSYDALEAAELSFPSAVAGDNFRENDFELAVALSTQLAIKRIAACAGEPNYDTEGLATGVFYTESQDGLYQYRYHDILHMSALGKEDLQEHLAVIKAIVDGLKEPLDRASGIDATTAVNRLRAKFPWDDFVQTIVAYYQERKRSINREIKAAGGVIGLTESIKNAVQGTTELAFAQEMEKNLKRSVVTPRSTFDKSDINKLRALSGKALTEANEPPKSLSQGAAPTAQMVAPNNPELLMESSTPLCGPSDDAPLEASPRGQGKNAPTKTGKPSLMDRQDTATRVEWGDDASQMPTQNARYGSPHSSAAVANHFATKDAAPPSQRKSSGKRTHVEFEDDDDEWDPTQDGAFQTGAHDMAAANERRRQTAVHQAQRAKSVSIQPPSQEAQGLTNRVRPATESPTKRQRKNPGSSVLPSLPPLLPKGREEDLPSTAWQQAKINANHQRIAAAQNRAPRTRKPWTAEEENCLLNLIIECEDDSIHWAPLKEAEKRGENVMANRTAEDLRMKARNMKVTMIRSGMELPGAWDKVVLGKKEIESLEKVGINYQQRPIRAVRGRRNDDEE